MKNRTIPIALTMGDPAGIGLDIAIQAWMNRNKLSIPKFFVVGSAETIQLRAKRLGVTLPVAITTPETCLEFFDNSLPLVPTKAGSEESPGHSRQSDAAAVIESIKLAVKYCRSGDASAVVTNPISKKSLHDHGFKYPGHTEFLASLVNERSGKEFQPVMMMVGPSLRTVPITIHESLKSVPVLLDKDRIANTIRTVDAELRRLFGIPTPKLAVTGLNPHAGENGSFGCEEVEIIKPAIELAVADGIEVTGPFSADSLFQSESRKKFDCIITMYHDQALIPVKTLDFEKTVNVTLGLPFVRTSPDHGTALDIAGSGTANPSSLIEAIKLAHTLSIGKGDR